MNTAASNRPRIKKVDVSDRLITARSWRLSAATPEQCSNFELIGDGEGVHSPDVDEDISAQGMLTGVPARRPKGTGSK